MRSRLEWVDHSVSEQNDGEIRAELVGCIVEVLSVWACVLSSKQIGFNPTKVPNPPQDLQGVGRVIPCFLIQFDRLAGVVP